MSDKYIVTDVNERRRFTPAGQETVFIDIHITTTKGARGSIRIPSSEYNKEKVQVLLDQLQVSLDMPFDL